MAQALKIFAFVTTSKRDQVVCKEVNTSFVVGAVAIIHMHDRCRAVQKFHQEHCKRAFGKVSNKYEVIYDA